MSLCRVVLALVAALGTVGLPPSATASPVSYYFSGIFQQITGTAPAALAGTAFAGAFTYDPAAAVDTAGPNVLTYAAGSASISVQTALGGGQTNAGLGQIQSRWDSTIATTLGGTFNPADEFAAGAEAAFDAALSVLGLLTLQFVDGSGGAPDDPFGASLSAPPTVLSLTEIDAAEIRLTGAQVVDGVFRIVAAGMNTRQVESRVARPRLMRTV